VSERPDRDLALERMLGGLEAPPAKRRFHERLWERIDAAETRPLERGSRRRLFRRPRLAVALLVAAAAAVWAVVWLSGWPASLEQGFVGSPPAVAQVIQHVRLRLDSCRSLSAVFTYERAGAPPFRARVLATSDGRVRTTAIAAADGSWRLPPADATLAHTPGLHVEVTSQPDGTRTEAWNAPNGLTVARSVNLAPGPPDAAGSGLFPAKYAGQMSTLAIAGAKVSASTYEDRRVLVVSAPAGPTSAQSAEGSPASPVRFDRVSMMVDRETWLPIRVVRTYRGALVEAWSLRDVHLDPPLLASDFSVHLPGSAELVTGGDQGFHRLSLAKASNAVHGRLFVPSTLPDGFDLSLATVRIPEPTLQSPWLSDESAVASLVYRRGFRSIVVTSRSFRSGAPDPAVDPFVGSAARATSGATAVLLRAGGLAGATAHLSARPLALPHLWVVQHGLLVTVAGDVTRRELRQIAESLETYGVWRTREAFTAYAAATRAYDLSTLRHLYAHGVEIDGRSYSAAETDDAMIRNSEQADYFVSGEVVSAFVGRGTAVWEAWPGDNVAVGGWYSPEAVAEIVTVRGETIAREEFFWITGPNLRAGEKSPHPARLRTPLGPGDTAAAARRVALAYVAGLKTKDAGRLARLSTPNVTFLDVGYGDHGRRSALLRRYERMFRFPADLAFTGVRTFWGSGWAVVRWAAASDSLGYEDAAGLTVLEIRGGKIARQTLYCAKDRMPFR
jgi:hypothetical protein